jgi:hypothetical protein
MNFSDAHVKTDYKNSYYNYPEAFTFFVLSQVHKKRPFDTYFLHNEIQTMHVYQSNPSWWPLCKNSGEQPFHAHLLFTIYGAPTHVIWK